MAAEGKKNDNDKSLLLQKVFEYVSRYFVIIAGSLSGTTGLFTATGFIAERSHLTMLGFSIIPVDLELYLYTGAKFFALLPALILTAVGLNLLRVFEWVIGIAIILILWGVLKRFKIMQPFRIALRKFREFIKNYIHQHRSGALFIFMVLNLAALFQMFVAFQIKDLLFETAARTSIPIMGIFSGSDELKFWIFKNDITAISEYMGKLFIIVTIVGIILWSLIYSFRKKESIKLNLWQNLWLGITVLLLLTQLILLPANFGVLLLSNEFPVVEVNFTEDFEKTFSQGEQTRPKTAPRRGNRLLLLHQDGNNFYLYSRSAKEPKVWYVDSGNIHSLVYIGRSNAFTSLEEPGNSN